MELKSQFYSTFSKHFRSVENINLMIENENSSNFNRALQLCVQQMRERGSNIFDVSTAISRPIQRCLKYPLYIGELLKNTPINHPDHPKLMEALRQLGDLASRMNESKRRKELGKLFLILVGTQILCFIFSLYGALPQFHIFQKIKKKIFVTTIQF